MDDIPADIDFYARLKERPVVPKTTFSEVVVVDNLPIVGKAKLKKLERVITRLFGQFGKFVGSPMIPFNEEGTKTLGYTFIEYRTAEAAKQAIENINEYPLDKQHILQVCSFDDFSKLDEKVVPLKEWELPKDLSYWLFDKDSRDQYLIRYDTTGELYWNEKHVEKPRPTIKKRDITTVVDCEMLWSPYGRYLATFHAQGVSIIAGKDWSNPIKFHHPGVRLVDFSPQEKYLVTCSPRLETLIIWDLRTGEKLFQEQSNPNDMWPAIKWNFDEEMFGILRDGKIFVFETKTMMLNGGKPFNISNVQNFSWSPKDNKIVCWTPAVDKNTPARIMMISMPDRKLIRSHNLFQVEDCRLIWHNTGEFLFVKVDRLNKKKKSCKLEFCRMWEKGIPIESLDSISAQVIAFQWEPNGQRFALIKKVASKFNVGFYSMADGKITEIATLEKRSADTLFWSPQGRFIVLAGMEPQLGGNLEFYDVDTNTTMRTDHHMMLTRLQWDPSGRYVASVVSYLSYKQENGFTIWNFQGQEIYHVSRDKFYEFQWRPRPPTPLSKEELEEIQSSLKAFSKRVKQEDAARLRQMWEERVREREEERSTFLQLREQKRKEWQAAAEIRRRLLGGVLSDDDEIIEIEEEAGDDIPKDAQQ